MKMYGLLWADGAGERSVKAQRELLKAHGVEPDSIVFESGLPEQRDDVGNIVVVPFMAQLGSPFFRVDIDEPPRAGRKPRDSARNVARRWAHFIGNHGVIRVLEGGAGDYTGGKGCADLIEDWSIWRGRRVGSPGGKKGGRPPGQSMPGFFKKLSPSDQALCRELFETRKDPKTGADVIVREIAERFDTHHVEMYRAARVGEWKYPDKD